MSDDRLSALELAVLRVARRLAGMSTGSHTAAGDVTSLLRALESAEPMSAQELLLAVRRDVRHAQDAGRGLWSAPVDLSDLPPITRSAHLSRIEAGR